MGAIPRRRTAWKPPHPQFSWISLLMVVQHSFFSVTKPCWHKKSRPGDAEVVLWPGQEVLVIPQGSHARKKALERGKSSVLRVGALLGTAWELAGKKLIQRMQNCLEQRVGIALCPSKCPQGYLRKCGAERGGILQSHGSGMEPPLRCVLQDSQVGPTGNEAWRALGCQPRVLSAAPTSRARDVGQSRHSSQE